MDWKSKLTSRKFWMSLCGLVSAMSAAFNFGGAAKVTAVIMAFGSVVSYILAEGWVDAEGKRAEKESQAAGGSDVR